MSKAYHDAETKLRQSMQCIDPMIAHEMIDYLVVMANEYHASCNARDCHEKEFERLLVARYVESIERKFKDDQQLLQTLMFSDGTGKVNDE